MGHEATTTDVLLVSEQPLWPLDQGYRVHGCQMARALAANGLRVRMSSIRPSPDKVAPWLEAMLVDWPEADASAREDFEHGWAGPLSGIRRKLAGHQALDVGELAGLVSLVRQHNPATVVALGQHGPMMLRGLRSAFPDLPAIWYAADEPVSFQLSCLRREGVGALKRRAYLAAVYAGIHAAFARGLHGAIGVSPIDTRLLKTLAGVRQTINIPNGVDTDYFRPSESRPDPCTLVFWGRLDFEPNIDAVRWFTRRVWPKLRERQPQARLRIVGKNATDAVRRLGDVHGIEIVGAVDDIRPHAHGAAATILPMRCGGGIKNKLLEAAAMGLPILASPRAVKGLKWPAHTNPVCVCRKPTDWVRQIERVWYDGILNKNLRRDARAWVTEQHTWSDAAYALEAFVTSMTDRIRPELPAVGAGTFVQTTAAVRPAA